MWSLHLIVLTNTFVITKENNDHTIKLIKQLIKDPVPIYKSDSDSTSTMGGDKPNNVHCTVIIEFDAGAPESNR